MSFSSGERTAHCLKAVRLPIAALGAMTLAACAQSSLIGSKDAPLATRQQLSPGPDRTAASVTNGRKAAGSPDRLYGLASFYTEGSETASGERLDGHKLTAAHRTLPFGTRVRVTNVTNGRSVTVRINDRGPFVPGRVVDVSYFAAETLGMTGTGVAKVKLEVVP
ncbi:MAG: septal ring lytic transglycosylase RlpA family protein [Xanthobacteraceae bacterium]